MLGINVKTENNEIVVVDEDGLAKLFFEQYPEWAGKAIANTIMNDEEILIDDPLNLASEKCLYKIIDIEDAASMSGIGMFDMDKYDDEEYPVSTWLEDIEMNLDAHVHSNGTGTKTEFLIKNI